MNTRIDRIRENEKRSHTKVYTDEVLYNTDSWLKKPIKTVQELMPLLSDYDCLRVLDLGCGIGRNSIYIAENYRNKHRNMTRGHKCDYRKQVSETKLDGAVVEVLRKLVSNKKFAGMMREKINIKVDTTALDVPAGILVLL